MGKKVSPHSFRLGITRTWDSLWYSKRGYKKDFLQDIRIRRYLTGHEKFKAASLSKVEIHRKSGKVIVYLHSAKPGMIVGRGGDNVANLQKELKQKFGEDFEINVQEIRKPELDAQLVANEIATQVEKRFPYRRVAKMAVEKARESGAKGIKIIVSGRLNGVDIARQETFGAGKVPLHTLRANIDYALSRAETTYGTIGIKVWIYHGLVFKNEKIAE
ncbi:MAG TPA: 30S ribosomal protein S3 [Candidatus Gracilibacteria bacterium]